MRTRKRRSNLLASAVLLVGLVGVLILNLAVVSDLPSRLYTAEQLAYLDYNRSRSIRQVAPSWDIITVEGSVQSAILSYVRENRVRATLYAHYEEQEGVSVTVYDLDFRGEYDLLYDGSLDTTMQLFFPFPDNLETLHEVRLLVDGKEPPDVQYTTGGISWQALLRPGEERQVQITYQADGANSFAYGLYHGQRSDVDVAIAVVGLAGSTVPGTSLPATGHEVTDEGESLSWDYADLIIDRDIQLTLPARLSFAQRIAAVQDDFRVLAGLAPLLVGLFLASLAAVFHLTGVRVGPESYLLSGCGLALFFPLLIFLSGIVGLIPAAFLSLVLVSGLLLIFLGLTAGWQHVRWRVGLLLFIFLGVFSLGILTPWRGLMLTSGGLLLIGTLMLLYARRPLPLEPEPSSPPTHSVSGPDPTPPTDEMLPESEHNLQDSAAITELVPSMQPGEVTADTASFYCPYCGCSLVDEYRFCPGCGHSTNDFRRCHACGVRQFIPAELDPAYCPHCAQQFG
jgi:hypothetical protein